VDEVTFGVRSIEVKEAQLWLNGESVRLVGLTRHADSPAHGLAETTAVMAADYDDLKALNEVLTRPVHYPQHEFILDYCDRHGILLIPEVPAWQLTAQQMADPAMRALEKQQLREMVQAGFNHPSVWAWSVGNEIESETRAGREFVREMIAYVKTLDPTRPVGFASNRLYRRPQEDATDLADLVLMNQYFGTWGGPKQGLGPALDWIHQTWPDKAVIISEFGFEPRWNRLWGPATASLDPAQYYFVPDEALGDAEAADGVRQRLIAEQMAVLRSRPFVVGAIFWTYQDYRTLSEFKMGVVDDKRRRRGSWQILREEYAPAQFVAITLTTAAADAQAVTVRLAARGPVANDLPAYTLTGYRLAWSVTSPDAATVYAEGELPLPVLAPADAWTGRLEWPEQADYRLTLRLLRPTGFVASEVVFSPDEQISP
jgi:beta-galactosidase/beta-glucuronidase